jgi:hypothetical protein
MSTDSQEIQKYKSALKSILERTILKYPFDEKTDAELIADAIERGSFQTEFAIFRIGETERNMVPFRGEVHEKTIFSLHTLNLSKRNRIEIKLSSFIYPVHLIAMLGQKGIEALYSTYKNKRITSYSELYQVLETLTGEKVLVTTSWEGLNKYASISDCINIVPLAEENKMAEVIRAEFIKARIQLFQELRVLPGKYFNFGPVKNDVALEAFKEFEHEIRMKLNKLQNM